LGERENSSGYRPQTSISNVVHNISQFLPRFDQLPGVQSIRNGLPNSRPGGWYPPVPQNNIFGPPPFGNNYPPPPPNIPGVRGEQSGEEEQPDEEVTPTTPVRISSTTPKSRTKLTDDSRNSMVMQQWQGPVAFANRYVPWERDQQMGIVSGMQAI